MGISIEDLQRHRDGTDGATTVTLLPDPEPRERWATIFSVDDHVVEPPDIFEGRFPRRYTDAAPRVVDTDNGGQAWQWLNQVFPNVGFNAVVGRPRDEFTFEPTRFEHMRRGPGTSTNACATWISTACGRPCAFRRSCPDSWASA